MRESSYPLVSVQDALAMIQRQVALLPVGVVALPDALGLTLAADVHAPGAQPPFPASLVDGYALRAADGHAPRRLIGEQMAGYVAELTVAPGTTVRITTGAPIPSGADAVVMVERADELDGLVTPHPGQPLHPGLGIRPDRLGCADGRPRAGGRPDAGAGRAGHAGLPGHRSRSGASPPRGGRLLHRRRAAGAGPAIGPRPDLRQQPAHPAGGRGPGRRPAVGPGHRARSAG
ncbi:MAG: hypothetical protein V9H69_26315 [Anaerolineae bacterium]